MKLKHSVCILLSLGLVIACSESTTTNPLDAGTDVATSDGGGTEGGRTDGGADGPIVGPTGGPVGGAQDKHCTEDDGATIVQATSAASCHPEAGPPDDGGMEAGADAGMEPEAPTMFNAEGDDDDCKYHVRWTATPIQQQIEVNFAVVVTTKTNGQPLTGAPIRAEVFLNATHPAPNTTQKSTEGQPGTYTVGPIKFDASGQWTVRFHFHEECDDTVEDSPHGHAAFFVQVP